MKIVLVVNGEHPTVHCEQRTLPAALLRDKPGLTCTHIGCDTSQCGCCTVRVVGQAVESCTMLAAQAEGCQVVTIEGIAKGERLHAVQQAFSACHGLQCGFCTPGMIMASVDLLKRHPAPTDEQIREGLAGNLGRCTGYVNIVAAVKTAAAQLASAPSGAGHGDRT